MKKIFFSALLWISLNLPVGAGEMTLQTYYPAPFGSYARLRLVPSALTEEDCAPGTLYVDINYKLRFCTPQKPQNAWGTISTRIERGELIVRHTGEFPVTFRTPFSDIPLLQFYYQILEDPKRRGQPGPVSLYSTIPVTNITSRGFTFMNFLQDKPLKIIWIAIGD